MKGCGVLIVLACCLALFGAEILSATSDVRYELNKPLEAGDIIVAWGVYSSSVPRFNVNIIGQVGGEDLILLHVDFRPPNVVLNSRLSNGWQTEIRPEFDQSQFVDEALFKVCVVVHTDEYRIFLNGVELFGFPHSAPFFLGIAVELHGGDGSKSIWSTLHLPNYPIGPGLPFSVSNAVHNTLDRPMLPGDTITAWGIYASGSSRFTINFILEGGEMMLHVDFRLDENEVVLNSYQTSWQTELRHPLPAYAFLNSQIFRVQIMCKLAEFCISLNGEELATFPYREGLALVDVAFVEVRGGSAGMAWTDLRLPGPPLVGSYPMGGWVKPTKSPASVALLAF